PPYYIINFPTKGHWKSKSRLEDIRVGLEDLIRIVQDLEIRSIALPPLGCGSGGLEWREVRPLIETAFKRVPDVEARLYPPEGAPPARTMRVATESPRMTWGRAALLTLLERYLRSAVELGSAEA